MFFPPIPTGYIAACADRILNIDEYIEAYMSGKPIAEKKKDENQTRICMRMTKVIQHTVGASPQLCAICMLRGEPSEEFIEKKISAFMGTLLNMAHKGWYKNNEDVITIIRRAYPYLKKTKQSLQQFTELLVGCVELKRISLEQAEQLVSTEMKELLDEPTGQIKAGLWKTSVGLGKFPAPDR